MKSNEYFLLENFMKRIKCRLIAHVCLISIKEHIHYKKSKTSNNEQFRKILVYFLYHMMETLNFKEICNSKFWYKTIIMSDNIFALIYHSNNDLMQQIAYSKYYHMNCAKKNSIISIDKMQKNMIWIYILIRSML